ncbi:MFS transporter [Actinopolyspora mortivallis]|uniref:MFS transporter n=1 Tax=Actinopolyspora mortivallis TaxID=33906 RepID=A0A2T0GYN1_ACTMO|nr:MFS transporter [Actinopolyspora mortivallis]PRW64211.1 MFS transporter [Actinopolyspora mortivallis]
MTATLSATSSAPSSRPFGRLVLLFVLAGNMLIDALEVSVVLVALPEMAADLALSPWQVQWVMSGFALGFALLLLLGPSITGRWGRRRPYLIALLLFAVASLVGGLTDSAVLITVTRLVKGACAALTAPTGLGIIGTVFPEGEPRRKAISVYSLFGAAGFTVGVLVSGVLTGVDWHWVLALPGMLALVLAVFAMRLIPEGAGGAASRIGFGPLRNPALRRSALGGATLNGTYLGLLLLLTFSLQDEHGWSSWQTALAFLPACLPLAVAAPFSGRMVTRFGGARLVLWGALAPLCGYLYQFLPFPTDSYGIGVLPTLLLVGLGFVLSFGALNMRATSELPERDRTLAVPLYQCAVQTGAVVMLTGTGGLLLLPHGGAYTLSLITAVSLVGVLVALSGVTADRRVSARKEYS